MNEQRRVETVEEFKSRIAAIIGGKADQITGASRSGPLLVPQKAGDQPEIKTSKDSIGLRRSKKSARAKIKAALI